MTDPHRIRESMSRVTDELWLGGRYPMAAAVALVEELGIRYVVDLRSETCDDEEVLRSHGITLLHLPTRDLCAIDAEMIDDGVAWVCEKLSAGHSVFIHCEHGIGRSALLLCCVLVARGVEPMSALEMVKDARERVSPSPEQLVAFLEWTGAYRRRNRVAWEVPAFDQLAALAYRHLPQMRSALESH